MMDIEEEMGLIDKLVRLDAIDIQKNKSILLEILDAIETSHTQSIFQVDSENIKKFKDFSEWIRGLKEKFPEEIVRLEVFAENMEATFF
jgi:hypothetical protein